MEKSIEKRKFSVNIILILLSIILAIFIILYIILPKIILKDEKNVEKGNVEETENLDSGIDINSSTNIAPSDNEEEYSHIVVNLNNGEGKLLLKVLKSNNSDITKSKFELYDKDGYYICQLGVDSNGYTGVKGMATGKYYFKQIETQEGYELDNTLYRLTVTEEYKTFNKKIILSQLNMTTVLIVLKDEDGNPIKGATFDFYSIVDGNSEKELTITTNKEGLAGVENLKEDCEYFLVQTSTPDGYEKTNERYEVKGTLDGKVERFDIINKKVK